MADAGTVFVVNAASFLAVIAVIWWWKGTRPANTLPREHVGQAIRAGGRYVAASPALRAILVRARLFALFASSITALLPLTARSQLGLGSGGYGLLLACVGAGALAGAALLPRLRDRLTPSALLTAGSAWAGGVALVQSLVHVTALVAAALVIDGMAWIVALSTLSSLCQQTLPQWAKARGMSFYLVVFQGGGAIGTVAFGVAAQHAGLSPALLAAAAGLALSPLAGLRYRFLTIPPQDLVPGAALRDARFSRRRTGASSWRVWQDSGEPGRILEQFVVASWQEHQLQRAR